MYMGIGQMAPMRIRKDAGFDDARKMGLQVGEHKWRARVLRYPQAGRETVFPGHASGGIAAFFSP